MRILKPSGNSYVYTDKAADEDDVQDGEGSQETTPDDQEISPSVESASGEDGPDEKEASESRTLKTRGPGLPPDFELTPDLEHAVDRMEQGPPCVFVTGRAGTGKSTLLALFRRNTEQTVAVVAPTGAAAINVRGQTIHSFFRFPTQPIGTVDIKRLRHRKMYEALDVLVIDEVSMVRADLLDGIDRFLRLNGPHRGVPFGGVRVILIGDPFQLPPVVSGDAERAYLRQHYKTPYFFSARVLRETGLETLELERIFRQRDRPFIDVLNAVREARVTRTHLELLNQQVDAFASGTPDGEPYVTLCTTNRQARTINEARLDALDETPYTYEASLEGTFADASDRLLPTAHELVLKEGAQVMFVKNDAARRWVNGTLGRIYKLRDDLIEVEIGIKGRGRVVEVEPMEWEMLRYAFDDEEQRLTVEATGSFTQYPVVPAYAITIHKSQGKTFEHVAVDFGRGTFAHGQAYVALSRCRSLDGLSLARPLRPRDIKLDRAVTLFHQHRHRLRPATLFG